MSKTLVVVESPAKAKTIKKYLGAKYEVMASKGHVKDLPKKIGNRHRERLQGDLRGHPGQGEGPRRAEGAPPRTATQVLLATDPDREGEAIAWHLAEELKSAKTKTKRVEFHEITKKGVEHGVAHPRELDKNLYDAQRARRVLDRIVGYDVSALVWSKLAFGLSAGRVQSVALRLIVDREREIEAFVPEEYWNCGAALSPDQRRRPGAVLRRRLAQQGRREARRQATATTAPVGARPTSRARRYAVAKITKSERKRNAPAPYTTSKLQQDAVNRLGFGAKRTMQVAQGLYEGVDLGKDGGGRSASSRTCVPTRRACRPTRSRPRASSSTDDVRQGATSRRQPNVFKSKKNAQDAHEAIRPTSLELHARERAEAPEGRAVQALQADLGPLRREPDDAGRLRPDRGRHRGDRQGQDRLRLRASGRTLKFAGWLEALRQGRDRRRPQLAGEEAEDDGDGEREEAARLLADDGEATLPELDEGEALHLVTPPGVLDRAEVHAAAAALQRRLARARARRARHRPAQHVRRNHQQGAGARLRREARRRRASSPRCSASSSSTASSRASSTSWTRRSPSKMEEELDEVEAGNEKRVDSAQALLQALPEQLDIEQEAQALEPRARAHATAKCEPSDGGVMLKRWSKNGWFLGCANYPSARTRATWAATATPRIRQRDRHRLRQVRQADGHPQRALRRVPLVHGLPRVQERAPGSARRACPKCGGDLIEIRPKKRGGKTFYGCSNYNDEAIKCDFKLWQKPIAEPCPQLRRAVPRHGRLEDEADDRLRQQGVRLQARGGRGRRARRGGRGRRATAAW